MASSNKQSSRDPTQATDETCIVRIIDAIYNFGYNNETVKREDLINHFRQVAKNLEFCNVVSFLANQLKEKRGFQRGILNITNLTEWKKFVQETRLFLKQFQCNRKLKEKFKDLRDFKTKLSLLKFFTGLLMFNEIEIGGDLSIDEIKESETLSLLRCDVEIENDNSNVNQQPSHSPELTSDRNISAENLNQRPSQSAELKSDTNLSTDNVNQQHPQLAGLKYDTNLSTDNVNQQPSQPAELKSNTNLLTDNVNQQNRQSRELKYDRNLSAEKINLSIKYSYTKGISVLDVIVSPKDLKKDSAVVQEKPATSAEPENHTNLTIDDDASLNNKDLLDQGLKNNLVIDQEELLQSEKSASTKTPIRENIKYLLTKNVPLANTGSPVFNEFEDNMGFVRMVTILAKKVKLYRNFQEDIVTITNLNHWRIFVKRVFRFLKQFDNGDELVEQFRKLDKEEIQIDLVIFLCEESKYDYNAICKMVAEKQALEQKSCQAERKLRELEIQHVDTETEETTPNAEIVKNILSDLSTLGYNGKPTSNELLLDFKSNPENVEFTRIISFLARKIQNVYGFELGIPKITDASRWNMFVKSMKLFFMQYQNGNELKEHFENIEKYDTKLNLIICLYSEYEKTVNLKYEPASTFNEENVQNGLLKYIIDESTANISQSENFNGLFDEICKFGYKGKIKSQDELISDFKSFSKNVEFTCIVSILAKEIKKRLGFQNGISRILNKCRWNIFTKGTNIFLKQFENEKDVDFEDLQNFETKLNLLRFLLDKLAVKEPTNGCEVETTAVKYFDQDVYYIYEQIDKIEEFLEDEMALQTIVLILENIFLLGYDKTISPCDLAKNFRDVNENMQFARITSFLAKELKIYRELKTNILDNVIDWKMFTTETNIFLKQLKIQREMPTNFEKIGNKMELLKCLFDEIVIEKMIECNKWKQCLVNIYRNLDIPKDSLALVEKLHLIKKDLTDKMKHFGPHLIKAPLLDNELDKQRWDQISKLNEDLEEEYTIRREMTICRLDLTLEALKTSEKFKSDPTLFDKCIGEFRKNMKPEVDINVDDILAARLDLLTTMTKVSDRNLVTIRSYTKTIIIGDVPDRGGRNIREAVAASMPTNMPAFKPRSFSEPHRSSRFSTQPSFDTNVPKSTKNTDSTESTRRITRRYFQEKNWGDQAKF